MKTAESSSFIKATVDGTPANSNISGFLKNPRLACKLDTVRLASQCSLKLKLEVQKVNALTCSAQLHRQPCLVSLCSFESIDLTVKCLTPNPGRSREMEFSFFLECAGKKLGIKASKAFVITKILERHGDLSHMLGKLRSDSAKLSRFQIFDLDTIVSGDVILLENLQADHAQQAPVTDFNFDYLRSSIPILQEQFIRTLVECEEEKRESAHLFAALPSIDGFNIIRRLGKGGIRGYSFLAQDDRDFQVVLKEYLPDRILGTRELSACLNSQRHCMLRHPNILQIREFFITEISNRASSCWSVQEFFEMKSVLDEVEAAAAQGTVNDKGYPGAQEPLPTTDVGLKIPKVYHYVVQALNGLQFLHDELQWVHGSIKLSNMILKTSPQGPSVLMLAHIHTGDVFPPNCKGATRYRSPESLESGKISREDDMFAIGCCIAAMVTGVVDREKGIKGHFGNSPALIQAAVRDVARMGDETLGSVVRILLAAKSQRMTARTARTVMERAASRPPPSAGAGDAGPAVPVPGASPAGGPAGAATLIRAHLMAGGGPRAFAGVPELLDAIRRGPPEQAEQHLQQLIGLSGDSASRAQILNHGGAKILVGQVRFGAGRVVERAAELIGQLCIGDHGARGALGAAGALGALLAALEAHSRSPLVTEAVADALTRLCEDFPPNCRELELAGGISKLRSIASEGGILAGTPRARRKCSVALRGVSISSIRLDDFLSNKRPGPARDEMRADTRSEAHRRFRSAVNAVSCGLKLAKASLGEELRWELEGMFFDGLQRAEELSKLFHDGSESELLNSFFRNLFDRLERQELTAGDQLDNNLVCCFVIAGAIRVDLSRGRDEVVQGPNFCTSHFLRKKLRDSSLIAQTACKILVLSKQKYQSLCEEFPQIEKHLQKIVKTVEVADRISLIRELDEKRSLQAMKVRDLIQRQMKKQATAQEVSTATQILECLESELLKSRLSIIATDSTSEKQRNHSVSERKLSASESRKNSASVQPSQEMFMSMDRRTHLPSIVDCLQDPMPKCLDAIRQLRDLCMHNASARELAGPAGAVQAVLNHCRSSESTNRSKIMAVEALSLLCDGHKVNKKVFGESHGIQIFVSMLEFPASRNSTQVLDINSTDTISAVRDGDSLKGREDWVQKKQLELLSTFPPSSSLSRITPALRRALIRFGCMVPKGTNHTDACTRLALAMRDGVAERVLLQERAAQALWILCRGVSDQEAFLRFILGKAGGIGALLDLMEHSTDRAKEFAAAAMYCACEDNIANRLMFLEAGGLAALCRLLQPEVGTSGSQEHAVATLRVMLDTSRRSLKGSNGNRDGSMSAREGDSGQSKAEVISRRRPATSRPAGSSYTAVGVREGEGADEGTRNQDTAWSDAGLESFCQELMELGVLQSLVLLLRAGTARSKSESAHVIRLMSLACQDCSSLAETCGVLEALVKLLGEEGSELPAEAAAALHAICLGYPANVLPLRVVGGIFALTRALTLPSVTVQERACAALLVALETNPACAFDMGEKGKECLRRLASVESGSSSKLQSTAEKTLLLLRMILASPATSLESTPGLAK